jgi:hypothetical protein
MAQRAKGWCELLKHRYGSGFPGPVEPPRSSLWPLLPSLSKETSEVSCQGQSHKKFTGYSQPATYAAGWRRTLGGSA